MLKNNTINLGVVKKIALALGDLNNDVVFVGGAVISLYANDPAAEDVRPTADIDISVQLKRYGSIFNLQEKLRELRFKEDANEKLICRFIYEDIKVDVMPDEDSLWGPTNKWYKPGFQNLQQVVLENETKINILPSPYFLATKFEAFKGRGGDYRTSHDFEDIVYLLDNRTTIVTEILNSDETINSYLKNEFRILLEDKFIDEGISAHLFYDTANERTRIIKNKMENILRD